MEKVAIFAFLTYWPVFFAFFFLIQCGNSNSGKKKLNPLIFLLVLGGTSTGTGTGTTGTISPTLITVTGTIYYEHVPVNTTTKTLNTSSITNRPARAITVQLVDNSLNVISSSTTNSSGAYSLSGTLSTSAFSVYAVAEMKKTTSPTYDFSVTNSVTAGVNGSKYSVASSSQTTTNCTSGCTVNVTALDSNHGNGPFSLLDVAYIAIQKVLTADSTTVFPQLVFRWNSLSTTGSYFTTSSSVCGTGIFNCITLYGYRASDSDEFDRHVVAHEFTHYLESALSRSDSVGGSHSTNDLLEPRVAYGEGLGNAMSAIFLDDPVYTDTTYSGGFNLNMETGTHTLNGFYSEGSVQSVIYDLYDSVSDTKNSKTDSLNYSFTKIWNAVIALKNISSVTYIHEFISALKSANSSDATAINNIAGMEQMANDESSEGNVTSSSNYVSTSHTCNGSLSTYPYLPIIYSLSGTGTVLSTTTFIGSQWCGMVGIANNKLFGSQFFKIIPSNSGTMTVNATDTTTTAPNMEDPDVYISANGVLKATCNQNYSETCTVSVIAGTTYIVEIRTFSYCAYASCSTSYSNASKQNDYTLSIVLP